MLAAAMPSEHLVSVGTVTATVDDGAALHERLLRGPLGEGHGDAVRYDAAQMAARDPVSLTRGVWPSAARASSSFGGGWSPAALVGPPRVFPRSGDIAGAWAPQSQHSPVEWVEVEYAVAVPVSALRVFETNRAGSTYAVVDCTDGARLLYAGAPTSGRGAQVLEVTVAPPRVIRRARVYVVNRGWSEIDTVGLLSAEVLPEPLRTRAAPVSYVGRAAGCLLVAIALVGALVTAIAWSARPEARGRPPMPSRPAQSLANTSMRFSNADPRALLARRVVWASAVTSFSTEYSTSRNAARGVVGPPDVYPRHGDLDGAWASHETDLGPEWIEVRFPLPVRAASVVWVETFNPGAVVRLDDVSDPANPVVLWEGAAGRIPAMAVVGEVTLDAPRTISAVRMVLDTRRVAGWNELDAIGLAPAP